MKVLLFKMLVAMNKTLLPKISNKDPFRLTKLDKAILGFKYWSLVQYLKLKEKAT